MLQYNYRLLFFAKTKIEEAHKAVEQGDLEKVQQLIKDDPGKDLAFSKDASGVSLLQKAVYYDQKDIAKWLLKNYPTTVLQKDRVSSIWRPHKGLCILARLFRGTYLIAKPIHH